MPEARLQRTREAYPEPSETYDPDAPPNVDQLVACGMPRQTAEDYVRGFRAWREKRRKFGL